MTRPPCKPCIGVLTRSRNPCTVFPESLEGEHWRSDSTARRNTDLIQAISFWGSGDYTWLLGSPATICAFAEVSLLPASAETRQCLCRALPLPLDTPPSAQLGEGADRVQGRWSCLPDWRCLRTAHQNWPGATRAHTLPEEGTFQVPSLTLPVSCPHCPSKPTTPTPISSLPYLSSVVLGFPSNLLVPTLELSGTQDCAHLIPIHG